MLAACASPDAPTSPRSVSRVDRHRPALQPTTFPTESPADPAHVANSHADSVPSSWGTDIDGIVSRLTSSHDGGGSPRIALTFDACDGEVDWELLEGLRGLRAPATLFLNRRWIERHPSVVTDLAADPLFELANHGTRHLPLSVNGTSAYGIPGTVSASDAVEEIWTNQLVLAAHTGVTPRHFRAGTAHYDDVAVRIVQELGMTPAGFTVNGDGGATFSDDDVHDQLISAPPGAIVLAHMNRPESGTARGTLRAIPTLLDAGTVFSHLDP